MRRPHEKENTNSWRPLSPSLSPTTECNKNKIIKFLNLLSGLNTATNNWYNKKTRTNNNKMGRKNNTNNGEQFLVLSLSLSSTPPLTFIWLLAGNEKNISACHKHTNTDVHLRSCRCVVVAAVVLVVFNFGVALQKRVCAGASEIELHFTLLLCNQINKLSSARSRQLFNC